MGPQVRSREEIIEELQKIADALERAKKSSDPKKRAAELAGQQSGTCPYCSARLKRAIIERHLVECAARRAIRGLAPDANGLLTCRFCGAKFKRRKHLSRCADDWREKTFQRAERFIARRSDFARVKITPREFPKGPITWVQGGLPQ